MDEQYIFQKNNIFRIYKVFVYRVIISHTCDHKRTLSEKVVYDLSIIAFTPFYSDYFNRLSFFSDVINSEIFVFLNSSFVPFHTNQKSNG